MFKGSLNFSGSPILADIVILLSFLTIVLYLAQDKSVTIPILDIIQTFLCWPTIFEGIHIAFCLWSFRHIERLLGTKCFLIYLIYNFIPFLPVFLLALKLNGFKGHFSFLFFIPFSLFVFMIWRLPSIIYSGPLTDKFIVCLSFTFIIALRFPYSILTLVSSGFGYYLWTKDTFLIKRLLSIQSGQRLSNLNDQTARLQNGRNAAIEQSPLLSPHENSTEDESYPMPINRSTRENRRQSSRSSSFNDNNNNNSNNNAYESQIHQIVAMGFSADDARNALQTSRGDLMLAIDLLLTKD